MSLYLHHLNNKQMHFDIPALLYNTSFCANNEQPYLLLPVCVLDMGHVYDSVLLENREGIYPSKQQWCGAITFVLPPTQSLYYKL